MRRPLFFTILIIGLFSVSYPGVLHAASVTLDAATLVPNVSVSFSPRSGSFEEGATFQVPIILDTNGSAINGIEVRINFDEDRLAIVQASTGQSIIGLWLEPASYDNVRGTAQYVGVVPNGIVTESGVIGTITFRAKSAGRAVVAVRSDSNIFLNDGLGSTATLEKGRAEYGIIPKPPGGVLVYSETHPSQSTWYNNTHPVLAWEREEGVTGFSHVIDTKPTTIPENSSKGFDTLKSFENLSDGLWYFHIKALKNGVWGSPTHFLVRIDTTPPARFKPEVNYVTAAAALTTRTLVSFFTTDNLSGVDHYEVGVIDLAASPTASPAFVESESPFQVPPTASGKVSVIVRAIDKAGNVRDESIEVRAPSELSALVTGYFPWIVIVLLCVLIVVSALRYVSTHHILQSLGKAWLLVRRENAREELKDIEVTLKEQNTPLTPPLQSETKDDTHGKERSPL